MVVVLLVERARVTMCKDPGRVQVPSPHMQKESFVSEAVLRVSLPSIPSLLISDC